MGGRGVADFQRVPFYGLLGLKLVQRSSSYVEVSMPANADLVQDEGLIHGGALAALADTAGVYLFLPDLNADTTITSIEFKLNFLRPVRPSDTRLVAQARPVRAGSRVAVAEVEVRQGEESVAKGLFTYLLLKRTARG